MFSTFNEKGTFNGEPISKPNALFRGRDYDYLKPVSTPKKLEGY